MAVKKLGVRLQERGVGYKYFKTIEQMSAVSGIGENTLRILVENREIDFISVGNRRLIADAAIWEWYERNKISALTQESEEPLGSNGSQDQQRELRHVAHG
jgi:excisionase family DNA binding protein